MTLDPFAPRGRERRRGPRLPVSGLEGAVSVVGATLVNVSRFGIMIESPVPLAPESVHCLRLVIGGRKSDVEARVAACALGTSGRPRRFDVGLEFTFLPDDVRARLERALSQVGSHPYPA